MQTLAQFLAEKGFNVVPDYSDVQRFDRTKPNSGWLVAKEIQGRVIAFFGDWATGEKYSFKSDASGSPEEEAAFDRACEQAHTRAREEKARVQESVALKCQEKWGNLVDRGASPYLERKGLRGLYGCKLYPVGDQLLTAVPARDVAGKLWGIQYISLDGRKNFTSGMKIKGCFHAIGFQSQTQPTPDEPVLLAEGVATAASLHEATGYPSLACFNAGNLAAVAQAFAAAHVSRRLLICGDDDRSTPGNPGRTYAESAARAVGVHAVFPRFHDGGSPGSDWNDLASTEGLDVVRGQVLVVLEEPAGGEPPAPPSEAPPPKKERISEKKVADWLLESMGGKLVRQDKSLFLYDGKKWLELFEPEQDRLKNTINRMCGDKLSSKEVNSIYRTFFRYVPLVPQGVNLFIPSHAHANFEDGTLHLHRDLRTGAYRTEFLTHRKEDYLGWVTPLHYRLDRSIQNLKFRKLLDEVFDGDPHKTAKIRSLKQVGGAMLMPAFSQLFFLHGVSGSRKSTVAKTLLKALSAENVSYLDPSLMEGFHLEAIVGKLVNSVLDIDDHHPLPRSFLKRLEDDQPFPVNRKNKPVVHTRLPAVHLYAANKLPPNFEGVCRALERRITIIGFEKDLTNDNRAEEIKFYEDLILEESREGVHNFMLDGLEDLIASGGKFTAPESSLAALREWQEERDPIAQFISAIREGEVLDVQGMVSLHQKARIERPKLYRVFTLWCGETGVDSRRVTNKQLFAGLRARGFADIQGSGPRYFLGLGARGAPENQGIDFYPHERAAF